jgi:hypothetical protein
MRDRAFQAVRTRAHILWRIKHQIFYTSYQISYQRVWLFLDASNMCLVVWS